jgi:hypothetical protein
MMAEILPNILRRQVQPSEVQTESGKHKNLYEILNLGFIAWLLDIILVSDSVFALWDENIRSSPACFVPLSWIPAVNFKKYKTKHNQILASSE